MRKRTSPDRIVSILRDILADLDAGLNVNQACRKTGINPTTDYRWVSLQEHPVSDELFRVCELEVEYDRRFLIPGHLLRGFNPHYALVSISGRSPGQSVRRHYGDECTAR